MLRYSALCWTYAFVNIFGMSLWIAICVVFLFAGMVKGVVGMGLPTVAMGLLATMMRPAEAATLLLAPSFVTNIWQLLAGPAFLPLLRRLWAMMLGVIVGTVAGAGLLAATQTSWVQLGLGTALFAYAVLGLCAVRFTVPARAERWLSPLIGLATGLVTGATGVFVIPAVPYLQALRLERDDLIQALGLSFTVSTVALAAGLFLASGFAGAGSLPLASLLALAPALLGMFAGQALREALSPEAFRRVFFAGLLLLGLYLAGEGLAQAITLR